MKALHIVVASVSMASLLAAGCNPKSEPPSAKTEGAGQIVFSQGSFEDAKGYKTFEEFKKAHQVIDELVVTSPQTSLRYYAIFREPLNAEEYIVQVFDRTAGGESVRSEKRDATRTTGQTTAGWTFDVPQWPIPEDAAERVVVNNVWVKPGHTYEVMILKPLAKGSFKVAAVPEPEEAPKDGKKTAAK